MVLCLLYGGGICVLEYYFEVLEVLFGLILGLKVVIFFILYDVKGLLFVVINDLDFVVFLEFKRIYRVGK